jgi:iron complex outermembrane receptor protein
MMSNSLPWLSSASLIALALAGQAHAAVEPGQSVSELVVTAAPYAISLDTLTTSVDILTARELSLAPPAGIGDLLAGMPGLRSTAYGPGASRPVIRGLAGPRVLLLQNGVGMVDASSLSPDHAVPSEPGQASRIEVLRGPSTLAYGGPGIGGRRRRDRGQKRFQLVECRQWPGRVGRRADERRRLCPGD